MTLSESHRRHLLLGGALAGPLFLTVSTVHGVVLPHYDARRHPVSPLALGPRGWLQTASFLTAGCLYGGQAVALWHAGPQVSPTEPARSWSGRPPQDSPEPGCSSPIR